MQVVARIECGKELRRLRRIADHRVEIDHAVVGLAGANPRVHRLPFGFAFGSVVRRTLERGQRRTDDLQAADMCALDYLLMPGDQISSAWRRRLTGLSDVVDAFEHDDITNARLRQHVAIEPGEDVD